MKRSMLLAAVLAVVLAVAAPALAQAGSANGVRGFITSISGSVVLVEENPADESGSAKGAFTVTDGTQILSQQGGEQVPAAFEDLAVGQLVEATYAGPVAESYPTQGNAGSIVILEGPPGGADGETVAATGVLEKPEATSYMYGTHAITDEASGTRYALTSESVNLDAYIDELVTIYGTFVPGYENGLGGGPPLIEVSWVEPAGDPAKETVTATLELAVECQPPAGTGFAGSIG